MTKLTARFSPEEMRHHGTYDTLYRRECDRLAHLHFGALDRRSSPCVFGTWIASFPPHEHPTQVRPAFHRMACGVGFAGGRGRLGGAPRADIGGIPIRVQYLDGCTLQFPPCFGLRLRRGRCGEICRRLGEENEQHRVGGASPNDANAVRAAPHELRGAKSPTFLPQWFRPRRPAIPQCDLGICLGHQCANARRLGLVGLLHCRGRARRPRLQAIVPLGIRRWRNKLFQQHLAQGSARELRVDQRGAPHAVRIPAGFQRGERWGLRVGCGERLLCRRDQLLHRPLAQTRGCSLVLQLLRPHRGQPSGRDAQCLLHRFSSRGCRRYSRRHEPAFPSRLPCQRRHAADQPCADRQRDAFLHAEQPDQRSFLGHCQPREIGLRARLRAGRCGGRRKCAPAPPPPHRERVENVHRGGAPQARRR